MDVSEKIDPRMKARLSNLQIECQVLKNLLAERDAALQSVVKEVLTSLTPNPTQYRLRMNPAKGEWELQLRPDMLVLPNQGLNRAERRLLRN